jgi:hypothetical protein
MTTTTEVRIDPITDMPMKILEYAIELSRDSDDPKMKRLWKWYREADWYCTACGGPYPTKAEKTGHVCERCGELIPRMTMIMPLPGSLQTGKYMRECYMRKRIAAWYRTQRTLRYIAQKKAAMTSAVRRPMTSTAQR